MRRITTITGQEYSDSKSVENSSKYCSGVSWSHGRLACGTWFADT